MRKSRTRLMVFLPLAMCGLWLTGCASTPTPEPAALPSPCRVIPLTRYTPEQRRDLAMEMDAAAGDVWPLYAREDLALRAAVRACSSP